RQIDGINLAGFGKAESALTDQLVMRFRLPPLKAGEKVDHMLIAFEHHHGVITPAIDPPAPGIWPDVRAPAAGLSGGSICPSHGDLPCHLPQGLGRIRTR